MLQWPSKHQCIRGRVNYELIQRRLQEARDFPGGSVVKNPPANAGYVGSIPGLGRSPGERNDNMLPYSCLDNPWVEEPGGL